MGEFLRLVSYVKPYRGRFAFSVVMMAAVGLLEGFTALLIRPIFDLVLNPAAMTSEVVLVHIPYWEKTIYLGQFFPAWIHNVWTVVSLAFLFVMLGKGLCDYLASYLINFIGQSVIMDLRNQLYAKIINQSISFFHHHPTGKLMSTIINDIEKIQLAVSQLLADFLRQWFTLVALLGVVLVLDWKLTLASLVLIPFIILPAARIGNLIRRSSRSSQDNLAEINQLLQETISGSRIVKAFGMEPFEVGKFRDATRRLLRTNLRWIRAHAVTSPLMELLGAVTAVFLLLYARNQILHQVMTTGMFAAFIFALFKLYEPIKRLTGINNHFQQALGASTKVFELLDVHEEVKEKPQARPLPPFRDSIEFDHVYFSYGDGEVLLKDIHLRARVGEVVAVVGSSGAGKTTLVNLLPRFFDVTAGRVLIDGTDVREVALASLRSQIGIVTQETILFNDTAWNNICYGRKDTRPEEVAAASRAALAHDFILQLPLGYDTIIGERGQRLSGGQRQRIAIARALLKNSPILILDEATSELDTESELLVQRALANLMVGRTVFVIAHRLSTIHRADKIVVLEDGMIREVGTHQDLLARGGIYQKLYAMQFIDADVARLETGSA